jgi:hypothetical protein
MLKKLLSALFLCLVCTYANAQKFPYDFTYTNEPYVNLTNATVLDKAALWEDGINLFFEFEFQFGNEIQDHMILDGYTGGLFTENSFVFGDSTDAILPYTTYPGFIAKVNTVVRYVIEGDTPNRIVKVEFYRVGLSGVAGEVTFQIWLYEANSAFEFRMGPQNLPNPGATFYNNKSPLIGFMLDYHYTSEFESLFPQAQFVVGAPAAPTDSVVVNGYLDEQVEEGPQYGLTGKPLENSVYTFTPGSVSTRQPELATLQISPNPALESVQLDGLSFDSATQVQLLDEQGKTISTVELPVGVRILRLPADLEPGIYLLRCTSGRQHAIAKFLKG